MKRAAQEVDVAARVAGFGIGGSFQPGVLNCTVDFAPLFASAAGQFGQTEVHELGGLVRGDEDVRRLQIAVGQPLTQGVGQTEHGLFEQTKCFGPIELFADRQEIAQIAALDEVHDDVILARCRVAIDGEDVNDIRVPHAQADFAFALKQLDLARVFRPSLAQYLDGHDLARARVIGPIDAAKAAGGDSVQEAIAAEKIAVGVAFEQLRTLPWRQVSLAFESSATGTTPAPSGSPVRTRRPLAGLRLPGRVGVRVGQSQQRRELPC